MFWLASEFVLLAALNTQFSTTLWYSRLATDVPTNTFLHKLCVVFFQLTQNDRYSCFNAQFSIFMRFLWDHSWSVFSMYILTMRTGFINTHSDIFITYSSSTSYCLFYLTFVRLHAVSVNLSIKLYGRRWWWWCSAQRGMCSIRDSIAHQYTFWH